MGRLVRFSIIDLHQYWTKVHIGHQVSYLSNISAMCSLVVRQSRGSTRSIIQRTQGDIAGTR